MRTTTRNNKNNRVKAIHIELLDDNTFKYSTHTRGFETHDYSAQSVRSLLSDLREIFKEAGIKGSGLDAEAKR